MTDLIVKGSTGMAVNTGKSVLSERQARIPVIGKIRAGIKVLTTAGRQHPDAQGIYDAGVRAGEPWDAIEKVLRQKCSFSKSPLTPRNVPYFTVRRSDFTSPDTADQILELYGEEIDGALRLRRFPVVLPTDSWLANMPHDLKCYTRSQLLYWSGYDSEGIRHCYTKAKPQMDPRSRRAIRTFGGRPTVLRPENSGICDPEKCPEYQRRVCNLHGQILVFIPGVPGSGAIAIPSTSFYAMEQAREKMEMVAYLRNGKISGTHNGKPIFYISKTEQEVSMLDDQGDPKRVKQYLITLEADIDMLEVIREAEQRALTAGSNGQAAAAALSGPGYDPDEDAEDFSEAIDGIFSPEQEEVHQLPQQQNGDPGPEQAPPPEPVAGQAVAPPGFPSPQQSAEIKALRRDLMDKLEGIDVTAGLFSTYAEIETGDPGWGRNTELLRWAIGEVEGCPDDKEGREAWKEERSLDTPF